MTPEPVLTTWRKFLILQGIELGTLGRPAHSQSLYRLRYPGSPEKKQVNHENSDIQTKVLARILSYSIVIIAFKNNLKATKSSVFWDVTARSSIKLSRCLWWICRFHLLDRRVSQAWTLHSHRCEILKSNKVKGSLNSANPCRHEVQNFLSSCLRSKKLNILSVVLYW
jgi:hypothetical protein